MNNDNNENNKIRRKKVSSSNEKANSNSRTNPSKNTITPKKKDKFKFFRITGIVMLITLVVASATGTGLVFSALKDIEPVTKAYLDKKTYEVTEVLYSNGQLMDKAARTNQKDPIPLDDMSEDLINAIVAIEDERFYEHNGVDIRGLIRSAVKTLTGDTQGGSTIPMQVSKMLLTTNQQTLTRKIKDIYYAYEMSKTLTKNEILEIYLNNFFVGRGLIGAQAGAYGYFSKDAKDLTLAESALLAGSTKYPNKYAAYKTAKLDGNETKDDVENRLLFYINTQDDDFDDPTPVELDMIDKLNSWGLLSSTNGNELYKQLKAGTMVVRKAVPNENAVNRRNTVLSKMLSLGYITQAEYDEASVEPITIKLPKKKDEVESALMYFIQTEVEESLVEQGNTEEEASNLYYNGGLKITTTIDPKMQQTLEDEYKDTSNFPGNRAASNGILQPQSSMVIVDYRNGHIKALVGGRNITDKQPLNRAIKPKQPGSTIKPLSVYTPAIDTLEITQSTVFSDARGGYKFNYSSWNPNTTTSGKGSMSFRKSLSYSSNTIAIKAAEMLGNSPEEAADIMIDYLRNFGITSLQPEDRSFAALTLGGMNNGISPLEMASAYGTLANGGIYIEPIVFTTITSFDGQLIVKNTPEEHKVVDPEVAYVMTDMLRAVVTEGIAGRAAIPNMPVAGKTGTTNGSLDVWFVGYTPYYVAATHIGDDAGTGDARRGVPGGSGTAAKLWSAVMRGIHENLAPSKFKVPDGVYFTKINLNDGGKSSSGSSAAFINGTAPKRQTIVTPKPEVEEEVIPPPTEPEVTPPPTEPEVTPPPTEPEVTPPPTEPEVTPPPTEPPVVSPGEPVPPENPNPEPSE